MPNVIFDIIFSAEKPVPEFARDPKGISMNRPRPTRRWGATALVLACALAASLPGIFDATPDPAAAPEFAPGEAGLRAALDPETGELAVGADAMRLQADKAVDARLRESLSRSDEGLTAVRHPAGHVGVNLEGRFMSMSLARVDADGTVETICTHDADAAEAFLSCEGHAKPETDANGWEVR
jgi:hypothetical protein